MPHLEESPNIAGVLLVQLKPYSDTRGRFMEIFRKEWFPQRRWDVLQSNRSDSAAGVVRGLHYHHHQVDYWYVQQGKIRAGLYDLRPSSPTFRTSLTIDLDADRSQGLYIPIGVAHGFAALTAATLTYYVDNYYDGDDEYGVAWDDPEIGLDWGIPSPILSDRDANNPRLQDIPQNALPGHDDG